MLIKLHGMVRNRVCPNSFFVSLLFFFVLVLFLKIVFHWHPLAGVYGIVQLGVASHDNLVGVEISQSKLKLVNITRLDIHLRGRVRGWNLLIQYVLTFFLPRYLCLQFPYPNDSWHHDEKPQHDQGRRHHQQHQI